MLSKKSESDITSLAPSSPSRSPKRPVYYVQNPSRDSHDGDKSSSMQPTPMESPPHPSSFGRLSRNSSASRFSGIFRSSSERKGNRKRNDKGWPECNVIIGMILRIRRLLGVFRPCHVYFCCFVQCFAWLFGVPAGLTKLKSQLRYANLIQFVYLLIVWEWVFGFHFHG